MEIKHAVLDIAQNISVSKKEKIIMDAYLNGCVDGTIYIRYMPCIPTGSSIISEQYIDVEYKTIFGLSVKDFINLGINEHRVSSGVGVEGVCCEYTPVIQEFGVTKPELKGKNIFTGEIVDNMSHVYFDDIITPDIQLGLPFMV